MQPSNFSYNPRLIFICLLLVNASCKGLAETLNDTSFLYRKISKNSYHAIFIDPNPHSPFYNNLSKRISIDSKNYNGVIQQLKDSGFVITREHKINFPSQWYSLFQYKRNYYVYSPLEPYMNTWISINDSTLILNYFNDGCIPAFITAVNRINNRTIEIKTHSLYKEDSLILIHFINRNEDVAVIEFPFRNLKSRYILMVSKNSLRKYPIIVNYCKDSRTFEWAFDKPDFNRLIKG